MLLAQLPDKVMFADVETTGLRSTDRVVSLGLVTLDLRRLRAGDASVAMTHLVFDPGRKSHPRAEAVHGYSDWTLRHQEQFADYADELWPRFSDGTLTVAHNAAFDQAFIEREFRQTGREVELAPFYCTMEAYRSQRFGRSNLNAILAEMGIRRSGDLHGALEDAWMAMLVFLKLHGMDVTSAPPETLFGPSNLRAVPPQPDPLPRRRKRPIEPSERPGPPAIDHSQQLDILDAARPTATMMMRVASADGNVSKAEVEAIALLVATTVERLGLRRHPETEHNLVGVLLEADVSDDGIAKAAAAIAASPVAAAEIGRWVREVTYSDGGGSPAEERAINSLAAAMHEARAR